MTTYTFGDEELSALRSKTVIIVGCATGNGANIVLADWNETLGNELAVSLGDRVRFQKCDVSVWGDVLTVFQEAWKTYGTIHAVVSNAGVNTENLLQDEIEASTGMLMPPNLKSLEINLIGMIYVLKCAVHYFAKWPEIPCQIVLTGSAATFLETLPLYLYSAAKTGLLGLMRSLRTQLVRTGISINLICPWFTVTPMLLPEMANVWAGLPSNQPEGVGRALLMPICRPDVNGKAFFIAGHQIVEFEDTLTDFQPQWMGEQLSKDINEGQRRLIP